MKDKADAGLKSVSPRELTRRICFDVFPEDGNPYDAFPLTVTMDPKGVSLHFLGDVTECWEISWADFRAGIERINKENRESEREEAEYRAAFRDRTLKQGLVDGTIKEISGANR